MMAEAPATNAISLDSEEGRRLLSDTDVRQDILLDLFDVQQHESHCGIQSAALLLASSSCGKACRAAGHCSFRRCEDIKERYHGFAMFSHQETRDIITHEVIRTRGTTLEDVGRVLRNHGHQAGIHFAGESSLDEFRRLAVGALGRDDSSAGVAVNFQRHLLGQIGARSSYGHHSPLSAYHAGTDRFLMVDTNVGKPKLWFTAADLFDSMLDKDSSSGRTRGFVIMGDCV